jgi:hypothetical protein
MDNRKNGSASWKDRAGRSQRTKTKKRHSRQGDLGFYWAQQLHLSSTTFWDFAVNNVLDSFYGFVEDRVEILPEEEKLLWSKAIMTEVAFSEAQKSLNEWKDSGAINLSMQWIEKSNLTAYLKCRTLAMEEQNDLIQQRLQLDDKIKQLVQQWKELEKKVTERWKASLDAKAELKKMRDKKSKLESLSLLILRICWLNTI